MKQSAYVNFLSSLSEYDRSDLCMDHMSYTINFIKNAYERNDIEEMSKLIKMLNKSVTKLKERINLLAMQKSVN